VSSVRTTTSLAPQTVTDVSTGTVPTVEPEYRRRDARGKWNSPVVREAVPDTLLASALEAAGGDSTRLWFGPDGAVWVLNHTRATKCISAALMRSVDRAAMLRAHTRAVLSTAKVRQAGSQDPDQFTEVIELLTMALEEDDRWLRR
jgi:hypothetical protein